MEQLSFSTITLRDLRKLVDIKPVIDDSKFIDWFSTDVASVDKDEELFLEKLIQRHRLFIESYSEEELKMKFLGPILNKVDFYVGEYQDWYERPLKGNIGGVEIIGKTDFMVARGLKEPDNAIFFIQEFKPAESKSSPQIQLVAEMLIALQQQELTFLRGAYIVGQLWYFVHLERQQESYRYYVSPAFDSLKLPELVGLYQALLFVKGELVKQCSS